jgi:hypothetical protein
MPDFRVFELEERHLALAYPLARSASAVSEARWHAFARETIAAGGGVLGIEAEDHCLYGLAAFRAQRTLRHGEALCVELLVAVDLAGNRPVRSALCASLDEIARARGLASVLVTLTPGCPALGWTNAELVPDTIGYMRQAAPEKGTASLVPRQEPRR